MEQAIIKEIFPEQHKENFRYCNALFEVTGEKGKRMLMAKVTGNAVDFIGKLKVGDAVVLIYPGEQNPVGKVAVFLMNESKFNNGKWYSELKCYKCYLNGSSKI